MISTLFFFIKINKKLIIPFLFIFNNSVNAIEDIEYLPNGNHLDHMQYNKGKNIPLKIINRINKVVKILEGTDMLNYAEMVNNYATSTTPERDLLEHEEVANAYKKYCEKKCLCQTIKERREVISLLFARIFMSSTEIMNLLKSGELDFTYKIITDYEAVQILYGYKLESWTYEIGLKHGGEYSRMRISQLKKQMKEEKIVSAKKLLSILDNRKISKILNLPLNIVQRLRLSEIQTPEKD